MITRKFEEVYNQVPNGWTIDNEGYLWGLTNGNTGYEKTDVRLTDLLSKALTLGACLPPKESNELDTQLYYLVRECQYIIKKVEKRGN